MSLAENIARIDELKAELDTLRPLSKKAEVELWEKIRLEWNFNSNHIEGNQLTYGETKVLLWKKRAIGDHKKREYDEMEAHDEAIDIVREWAADKTQELNEKDIKNLNEIILVKPYESVGKTPDGKATTLTVKIGNYKTRPNSVETASGEIFEYANPEETPRLMAELMEWFNSTNDHTVKVAAELHYKFIRIHPFDDGNGRVARLLVNYVLLRNGYSPIIIKSRDKENYITALEKADTGEVSAFYDYIYRQVIIALELELKAAKGESVEEPDDFDKEVLVLNKMFKYDTKISDKATPETVNDVLEFNVIPLFKLLDDKVKKLQDFFLDFEASLTYDLSGQHLKISDTSSDSLQLIINTLRDKELQINGIKVSYGLKGLRNTKSGSHVWLGLDVFFHTYNYQIKPLSMTQGETFVYGKVLPEEDLAELVKPMLKDAISRIKNAKD